MPRKPKAQRTRSEAPAAPQPLYRIRVIRRFPNLVGGTVIRYDLDGRDYLVKRWHLWWRDADTVLWDANFAVTTDWYEYQQGRGAGR